MVEQTNQNKLTESRKHFKYDTMFGLIITISKYGKRRAECMVQWEKDKEAAEKKLASFKAQGSEEWAAEIKEKQALIK